MTGLPLEKFRTNSVFMASSSFSKNLKEKKYFEHETGIDLTVSSTLKKPSKTIHVLFRDVSDYS